MQRLRGQVRGDGGETGQVRPGLGEGGEEGNRDKVMRSLRQNSGLFYFKEFKVWNKYSVCLDIVSSPSINKIYHVIN